MIWMDHRQHGETSVSIRQYRQTCEIDTIEEFSIIPSLAGVSNANVLCTTIMQNISSRMSLCVSLRQWTPMSWLPQFEGPPQSHYDWAG